MPLYDIRIPLASADVVAVFDKNFNQVFKRARPMKAIVTRLKKLMEHPVETGAIITDHQVIDPIEIELSMILQAADFRSTYKQIEQIFLDGNILSVQTKASTYQNLIVTAMPHDEDPELFDAISLAVKLKEATFVTAQYGSLPARKVADKSNASTVDRGEQQGQEKPQGSVLYRTFFD